MLRPESRRGGRRAAAYGPESYEPGTYEPGRNESDRNEAPRYQYGPVPYPPETPYGPTGGPYGGTGAAYGVEVISPQQMSPDAAPSADDQAFPRLAEIATRRHLTVLGHATSPSFGATDRPSSRSRRIV